ncbi:MAG: hypothetical protein EAZ55_00715 [Cytophagales bacterium]|nr:MAG: hypothetical protein EAZ55_00715 [Cytophagales bacterium]
MKMKYIKIKIAPVILLCSLLCVAACKQKNEVICDDTNSKIIDIEHFSGRRLSGNSTTCEEYATVTPPPYSFYECESTEKWDSDSKGIHHYRVINNQQDYEQYLRFSKNGKTIPNPTIDFSNQTMVSVLILRGGVVKSKKMYYCEGRAVLLLEVILYPCVITADYNLETDVTLIKEKVNEVRVEVRDLSKK